MKKQIFLILLISGVVVNPHNALTNPSEESALVYPKSSLMEYYDDNHGQCYGNNNQNPSTCQYDFSVMGTKSDLDLTPFGVTTNRVVTVHGSATYGGKRNTFEEFVETPIERRAQKLQNYLSNRFGGCDDDTIVILDIEYVMNGQPNSPYEGVLGKYIHPRWWGRLLREHGPEIFSNVMIGFKQSVAAARLVCPNSEIGIFGFAPHAKGNQEVFERQILSGWLVARDEGVFDELDTFGVVNYNRFCSEDHPNYQTWLRDSAHLGIQAGMELTDSLGRHKNVLVYYSLRVANGNSACWHELVDPTDARIQIEVLQQYPVQGAVYWAPEQAETEWPVIEWMTELKPVPAICFCEVPEALTDIRTRASTLI